MAVYWEFRSFKHPGAAAGQEHRFEVQYLIVGNLREFQEFHCIQRCRSQYTSMTASTILAGIINNNRKCNILILFLYPYLNIVRIQATVKSPGQINNWPKSAILSVEGIPGAPGGTDPITDIPQKLNVYLGSLGVSPKISSRALRDIRALIPKLSTGYAQLGEFRSFNSLQV
jgi:hypothetical protein